MMKRNKARSKSQVKKHVLVLNHYAVPLSQSGFTRNIELFSRLDASRWSFVILAANRGAHTREAFTTDEPHFNLIRIPPYDDKNGIKRVAGWLAYSSRAMVAGLCGERPDIVYASTPHLLTPLAGLITSRLRGSRFVLEVRDLWPESLVQFGYLRKGSAIHLVLCGIERTLYRAADHIVIVTPGWTRYLTSLGVPAEKVTIVPNGSDPKMFAPSHDGAHLRELLGVSGPVAIYAGAHGPPNGLEAVLDAAAELPEVTFVLYGHGASKAALVRRARSEGLMNIVFRDPVPKSELATLMWTADIGLHVLANVAIFREGMSPQKLYDYMAAKLPIVSNAGGAAHEIIEEAGCGVAARPDGLVEAIRAVLKVSANERLAMGERGHAWLVAHASREAVARDLERSLLATFIH